jgi:electron transfer flavoprotein beta subunit
VNVIALVKYVPSPQGTPQLGPDHRLVRTGGDGALDPGDEFGLEAALQLAQSTGGEVTVISMGPEVAATAIQRALAMGADRGVLITDETLAGADALVTARVLAAAIGRAPFDLVIAGVESTDGYTGTVPATIAGLLGVPSATFARAIDAQDDAIRIERQTESGYDVVVCPLPAVVTVTAGATEPRYPTLKGIMSAKSKPVDLVSVADLGLAPEDLRSTQSVAQVTDAPAEAGGEVIQAADDAVARIADLLAEAKVI